MENMNLTFVNVGYGEAILVSCPDASAPDGVFTMLIDGGSGLPEEYQNQPSGRLPVTEFVRRSGLGHLDAMVSTHIHEDHLCGLAALPDTLMPKVLWQSLPLDFCRRVMHPLPKRGGTVSRDNFLRSLNDALPLMERVCAAGGSVEDLGAGMERTLCPGLTLRVLSPAPEARRELMERMEALYAPQPEEEFFRFTGGHKLFRGKIGDVLREVRGGFNFGKVMLEGIYEYKGRQAFVEFQNENLTATVDGEILATTPDLICLVDTETFTPVPTDALKYGKRVLVVGLECFPLWRTPEGLALVGPRYFGVDTDYIPLEERCKGGRG